MDVSFVVQTQNGMCRYRSLRKAVLQNSGKYIMCSNARQTILTQRQGLAIVSMINLLLSSSFGSCIEEIILYGSTARGDYTASSDIDFLICAADVPKNDWLEFAGKNKSLYEYDIDFDMHLYNGKNIEEEPLTYYRNIRKDGITIWKRD